MILQSLDLLRQDPVSFILGGIAAIMGWVAIREPERQIQSLLGLVFGGVAFFTSFTPISF